MTNLVDDYLKPVLAISRHIGRMRRYLKNARCSRPYSLESSWTDMGSTIVSDLESQPPLPATHNQNSLALQRGDYPSYIIAILDDSVESGGSKQLTQTPVSETRKTILTNMRQIEELYRGLFSTVVKTEKESRGGQPFAIYPVESKLPIRTLEDEWLLIGSDVTCFAAYDDSRTPSIINTLLTYHRHSSDRKLTRYECGLCGVKYPAAFVAIYKY